MFKKGQAYNRRSDIHSVYGGQQQSGISTPSKFPAVFIFTGDSGEQYGYHDGPQPDGLFWYTGEGQQGDMQMTKGNMAVRHHLANGKALHLFQNDAKAHVRYVSECRYVDHHEVAGPDVDGNQRKVFVFELELISHKTTDELPVNPPQPIVNIKKLRNLSLAELRKLSLQTANARSSPSVRSTYVRQRSAAVVEYALLRSAGSCESCGELGPFIGTSSKAPFLEVHHMTRLTDGGPDAPENVAAICPNCHKEIHHGMEGRTKNDQLIDKVAQTEKELRANLRGPFT